MVEGNGHFQLACCFCFGKFLVHVECVCLCVLFVVRRLLECLLSELDCRQLFSPSDSVVYAVYSTVSCEKI